MGIGERWKTWAKKLKTETYALFLACKDPRVPWFAKAFIALVVGYAFSPIDLIPDFIPVLGYLDDLILIPLGITLALKLIPADVMKECREKAAAPVGTKKPRNWIAAAIIVGIWIAMLVLVLFVVAKKFRE
jgi:uncharacterized membrane protein YkvA (DUF1232 family)